MSDFVHEFFGRAKKVRLTPTERLSARKKIQHFLKQHPVREVVVERHDLHMETSSERQFGRRAQEIHLSEEEKSATFGPIRAYMEMYPLREKSTPPAEMPSFTNSFQSEWNTLIHMFVQRAVPSIVAILVMVSSSGVLSYAAESALPGAFLYPVKVRVTEPIIASLSLTLERKARWEVKRTERRLEEAEALAAASKLTPEASEEITKRLHMHTRSAEQQILALALQNPERATDIAAEFEASLSAHATVLDKIGNGTVETMLEIVSIAQRRTRASRRKAESVVASHDEDTLKESTSQTLKHVSKLIAAVPRRVEQYPQHMRTENRELLREQQEWRNEKDEHTQEVEGAAPIAPLVEKSRGRPPIPGVAKEPVQEKIIPPEPAPIAIMIETEDRKSEPDTARVEKFIEVAVVEEQEEDYPSTQVVPEKEYVAAPESEEMIEEVESLEEVASAPAPSGPTPWGTAIYAPTRATAEKEEFPVVVMEYEENKAEKIQERVEEVNIHEEVQVLIKEAEALAAEAEEQLQEGNFTGAFTSANDAQRSAHEAGALLKADNSLREIALEELEEVQKLHNSLLKDIEKLEEGVTRDIEELSEAIFLSIREAESFFGAGEYADVITWTKKAQSYFKEIDPLLKEKHDAPLPREE